MADTYLNDKSSTMHTYLCELTGEEGSLIANKLCPIIDFPDLGGTPDTIDITDLESETSQNLLGVQSLPTFEFLANFVPNLFAGLKDKVAEGGIRKYALLFGRECQYGCVVWEGELSVWIVGGGVNAGRQMRLATSVTNQIKYHTTQNSAGITSIDLTDGAAFEEQ